MADDIQAVEKLGQARDAIVAECIERYVQSVNYGLLKIMSKMGISVISSYRGGCNFETVGLSRTVA